jgi:hypothetical protein
LRSPRFIIFFIISVTIPLSLIGQTSDWTEETSDDGQTTVLSKIYETVNSDGEELKVIEYSATTYTSASIESCYEVFNNPSLHKDFYDYTEISEKIEDISPTEWIIYYFYDTPWPIPNSDCVSKITIVEDTLNSEITFNCVAVPNKLEDKGVYRSVLNDISFTFKKPSKEKVKILIKAKFSPVMPAPDWVMSGWFPNGPAEMLARFKKLAEKQP